MLGIILFILVLVFVISMYYKGGLYVHCVYCKPISVRVLNLDYSYSFGASLGLTSDYSVCRLFFFLCLLNLYPEMAQKRRKKKTAAKAVLIV